MDTIDRQENSRFWAEVRGLAIALAIALLIRTFLFQPFNIPTGSMYPTLEVGDFLVVTKYSYGFSRYSLPFAPPLSEGRVLAAVPKLGDVVVFNNPKDQGDTLAKDDSLWGQFVAWFDPRSWMFADKDQGLDYIKRLVGLPGDRIQVKAGVLHINGEPVKLERIEDYSMVVDGSLKVIPQFLETLPNGVVHPILKSRPFGEGALDDTPEYVVPDKHYFMMGDNRDNSGDSRLPDRVGFVSETQLVGKAEFRFFSTDAKWNQPTQWLAGLRLGRFFTWIR
ncbi:MAG: signal peptidase I [Alphaproteobacteria bacterium]